jgi:PAS domain S-box-containing protein
MKDQAKTKQALIRELASLRERITELEQSESKLKQAGEELRAVEKRLQKVYEHSFDVIYTLDCDFRVTSISNSVERYLGYRAEDLVGRSFIDLDVVAPESLENAAQDARRALTGDTVPTSEYVFIRKDGSRATGEVSGSPLLEDGKIIGLISVARDITERKQTEKELSESEKHYRMLFNAIDEGFCIVEVIFDEDEKPIDYRFLEINPSFEKQTGLIGAQGKRMRELAPKHEDYWFEIYGEIALTGQPARFVNRAEQLKRWYDVYAFRVGQPEDRQVAILFNDINERKRVEGVLHALSAYNRSLIEASLDPLVTIGADGKITDANAATEAATGYTRAELIGTEFSNYFIDPEQARAGYQEVFRVGSVHDYPLELRHRAGHLTSVLYNASVYRDAKGQVAGVFAAARNITERKRAEERIRASLREKEILLSEIHHRVKNNMQVISGLLDLQARASKNQEVIESCHESQSRIRSMAMIHEKLYDSKDFTRIDLAGYVRSLSQELFQSLKIHSGKIDLIVQADGDVYIGINKAIPCGLILNELISNVLKHAFPGQKPGKLLIIIHEAKGAEIEIVVRDNGLGLPADVDVHQPRTVGLHLVDGLVKNQLDGQIEVKRDKGTEFRIKFPS